LYSKDLYLTAYNKLYRNDGAMTPGTVADDTVDGMSLERIDKLIEQLRYERFRFSPTRRTYIPKKNGGQRPLGVTNFTDKLVQEVLRMILEAYYEPRFRDSSHGYRPGRGCHTALAYLKLKFIGSVWFIEGDIRGCFDNIDHDVLLKFIAKDIHDGRLLNLIRMSLEAGVLDNWQYHATYSGTPQGSVLSPLLSNIYLHALDEFIEDELIPQYTRGKAKAVSREYDRLTQRIAYAQHKGDAERVNQLKQERRNLPSRQTHDPHYRRLKYVRYADDFILGFIGPKSEAETIKAAIGQFLRQELHLELSEAKTLITHGRTQHARFLNYAVSTYQADHRLTQTETESKYKTRAVNGKIRLGIPYGLIDEHCKRYQRAGKSVSEPALLFQSDAHIIDVYQQRFRGIAEYYKFAVDRSKLSKLRCTMQAALVKTLAHKLRLRASQVYRKYRGTQEVDGRVYKTLQVEVPTKKGTRCIYWGAIPLRVVKPGIEPIDDKRYQEKFLGVRSDLIQRLQADTCELCGAQGKCTVHHVHKLKDLKKKWAGRREKPTWVTRMIAMRRKTLVVCKKCHSDIHAGRPITKRNE
jgi:group II intron reverse transcriptase/maturase